jgi:hypothetical protein
MPGLLLRLDRAARRVSLLCWLCAAAATRLLRCFGAVTLGLPQHVVDAAAVRLHLQCADAAAASLPQPCSEVKSQQHQAISTQTFQTRQGELPHFSVFGELVLPSIVTITVLTWSTAYLRPVLR